MIRLVTWNTDVKLPCEPTANVILCLATFTLDAQLSKAYSCGLCVDQTTYEFTYDDLDLPDGYLDDSGPLGPKDVKGAFCESCLTEWMRELVDLAFELTITRGEDDEGSDLAIVGSGPIEFDGGDSLQAELVSPNIVKYNLLLSADDNNIAEFGTDGLLFVEQPAQNLDGWIDVTADGWVYAGANTITVPAGALLRYSIGDRIKLVQGVSTSYFYVVEITSTQITAQAGSDYFVLNQAITHAYYSKVVDPVGFPAAFHFTTTFTGFSATPTYNALFRMVGRKVHIHFNTTATGISNAATFILTSPIVCIGGAGSLARWISGGNQGTDNGAYVGTVFAEIAAGDNQIRLSKDGGASLWTTSGLKAATFNLEYLAA